MSTDTDAEAFDLLHPSIRHHVVNSLGWTSLRTVQRQCVRPIVEGESVVVLAPTAGGKTEAAIFPVLSRMLDGGWQGLTVLYVCPIKALLNNLHERLERYCRLVGRRCGLWHGDVPDSERNAIVSSPPDILLTTPESLEVLLLFRHRKSPRLLAGVQVVVIDEMHAFAGDDRGWHLLSVLSRLEVLTGRPLQRVGLSATVGNPQELLRWMEPGERPARVIDATIRGGPEPDVQLDFVGSLENAAKVIAALHRGEKRLVFCDSRSRVEELARLLRASDVDTFVSHSSLSVDERRQAEAAFASRTNCVIVATSTLELGIDVGDLDRVIQIDAPSTVASFLQRIGRTGRRVGTRRNCLFLATETDALLRAAGLVELWSRGFVESVVPPAEPWHIFAQQIMALAIQQDGIAEDEWPRWLARVEAFVADGSGTAKAVLEHMRATSITASGGGLMWIGDSGEEEYGRKHFMELLSSFTSTPMFRVLHGQREIGLVDPISFMVRESGSKAVLLLAGRSWQVTHLDWGARAAFVTPSDVRGRSRWIGSGPGLGFDLCQAMKGVVVGVEHDERWSTRARAAVDDLRKDFLWLDGDATVLMPAADDRTQWWTFAGLKANAMIAETFKSEGVKADADSLLVTIRCGIDACQRELAGQVQRQAPSTPPVSRAEQLIPSLKFSRCLPAPLAVAIVAERMSDRLACQQVLEQKIRFAAGSASAVP